MTMQRNDDTTELAISALLDLELDRGDLLPTIDRLVDDPQLQEFYRQGRALDAAALEARQAEDGTGEEDADQMGRLWGGIESRSRQEAPASPATPQPTPQRWSWGLVGAAAAAVLLLGLALGLGVPRSTPGAVPMTTAQASPEGTGDAIAATLAPVEAPMTEQRFVQLAAELLQAEPEYRLKMAEILSVLDRESRSTEGTGEGWYREDRDDVREAVSRQRDRL